MPDGMESQVKLKTDAEGHAVLDNGKPVYIGDDGREVAYDPPAMHATIGRLNKEAQGHREAKEAAEAAIKGFEGIDPAAARKALDVVKNLDEAKLIDAGKVEEIKLAAIKSVEDKYKPVAERAETLERELYAERIGGSFARSKFIAEKLVIPADMVQAQFGRHFELKEGKILAKDAAGNTIYSDANPGAPAEVDEALEKLVQAYPHRDRILKGSGHSGSGSNGVDGGGGARVVTRQQFAAMKPAEQAKVAAAAGEGTVKLID
jgi:hypothetical protein